MAWNVMFFKKVKIYSLKRHSGYFERIKFGIGSFKNKETTSARCLNLIMSSVVPKKKKKFRPAY